MAHCVLGLKNGRVRKCEADSSHEWLLTPWPQKLHFCSQSLLVRRLAAVACLPACRPAGWQAGETKNATQKNGTKAAHNEIRAGSSHCTVHKILHYCGFFFSTLGINGRQFITEKIDQ